MGNAVQEAVQVLGRACLVHPGNVALRRDLGTGRLEPMSYYLQLLRLVYRVMLLHLAEERGLLPKPDGGVRQWLLSHDGPEQMEHGPGRWLWRRLYGRFRAASCASGVARTGHPTLRGNVFDPVGVADLEATECEDSGVLRAFGGLLSLRPVSPGEACDCASLTIEELCSAHETLLSCHPKIVLGPEPAFDLILGADRKQTGTYYTPRELIDELITWSLVPMVEARLAEAVSSVEKEQALLGLSVCDPACGSGVFLLAAARFIAAELARVRAGPNAGGVSSSAMAEVIGSCIFGVDSSPIAVDLCKAALWMECDPGTLALSRLDDRIRCGNALIGVVDLSVVELRQVQQPSNGAGTQAPPCDLELACDRWTERLLTGARSDTLSARQLRDRHDRHNVFHWPLAFPQVFAGGGFDVVLGNPPWELLQPEEIAFFRSHGRLDVAHLAGAERKRLIERLAVSEPWLSGLWQAHKRLLEAQSRFVRASGRFPLSGRGKLNMYGVFVETMYAILAPRGRAGCIVPSGFATDIAASHLFRQLMVSGALLRMSHFDNRHKLFPAVGGCVTFCLVAFAKGKRAGTGAWFSSFLHQVEELQDPARQFALTAEDVALLNPNTRTCPIFRSRRDAVLAKAIYRRVPIFVDEADSRGNPWQMQFRQGLFNMTSESHLFLTRERLELEGWKRERNIARRGEETCLPLYEAKMLHHFDHRWGTYEARQAGRMTLCQKEDPWSYALPRYWVPQGLVDGRLEGRWDLAWLIGWRLVCRSTDRRTVIGTVLPPVAAGNSVLMLFSAVRPAKRLIPLVACLNSLVLDYIARQKLGGINLNFHILKQLPVLPPDSYEQAAPRCPDGGRPTGARPYGDWVVERAIELLFTTWDLQPFAADCGYAGPPFTWDPERRWRLRCELDAAFFHLYGIGPDEAAYILDTFPILRREEEKAYGEFRTKHLILEIHDALLR